MAEEAPQSLANHARYDPWFHFFVLPVLLATFVISAVAAIRHPGFPSIWAAVFDVALVITAFKARLYALRVQDRLICLEQRLRLHDCLPDAQRAQIAGLSERQTGGFAIRLRRGSAGAGEADSFRPAVRSCHQEGDQKLAA